MNRFCAVILSAGLLSHAQTVGAAEILDRFVGVWNAEGTVRLNGFNTPEKIKCRIVGNSPSGAQVNLEGKCATSAGNTKFSLFIAQDAAGKVFAAKARYAASAAFVDLTGSRNANAVHLSTKQLVQTDDRLLGSALVLTVQDDATVLMVNTVTDQVTRETAQSLVLRLARKR